MHDNHSENPSRDIKKIVIYTDAPINVANKEQRLEGNQYEMTRQKKGNPWPEIVAGAVFSGVGLVITMWAWTHRPASYRSLGDNFVLLVEKQWVFNHGAFYVFTAIGVVVVLIGIANILRAIALR